MLLKLTIIVFLIVACCPTALSDDLYKIIYPAFNSVRFADDTHGWIAGHQGVFYTSDGGKTWHRQTVSISSHSPSATRLAIEDTGCIVWVDQQSVIIRSETGLVAGDAITQQWQHVNIPKRILTDLGAISFVDKSAGWGVGPFGAIYRTEDGGKTWKKILCPTQKHLKDIFAFSSSEAWISGGEGVLLHTTDGGQNWTLNKLEVEADLYSIRFFDRERGWILGTAGRVFRTGDGGQHWQRVPMPFSSGTGLNAVSFVNADSGWLVGMSWYSNNESEKEDNRGAILYTKDGGLNWEVQTSNTKDSLVDVWVLTKDKAWAIGLNGTILRTIDSGKNWIPVKID